MTGRYGLATLYTYRRNKSVFEAKVDLTMQLVLHLEHSNTDIHGKQVRLSLSHTHSENLTLYTARNTGIDEVQKSGWFSSCYYPSFQHTFL
jgi:hypothetical protein